MFCSEAEQQLDGMIENTDLETRTVVQILAAPNQWQDLRWVRKALLGVTCGDSCLEGLLVLI